VRRCRSAVVLHQWSSTDFVPACVITGSDALARPALLSYSVLWLQCVIGLSYRHTIDVHCGSLHCLSCRLSSAEMSLRSPRAPGVLYLESTCIENGNVWQYALAARDQAAGDDVVCVVVGPPSGSTNGLCARLSHCRIRQSGASSPAVLLCRMAAVCNRSVVSSYN
jgi:hypothetical protein